MIPSRPWLVLGTLGILSAAAVDSAGAVDTSEWKCESCPFEQGASGSVDLGPAYVSARSNRFGDFSGLDRKGGYLLGSGSVRYRGADGLYADGSVASFGDDAVSLAAGAGRAGAYGLRLSYDALPRHLSEQASSPFLGIGGNTLTLPAGYPAATTDAMPLAATLRPVDYGYKRSWLDIGASWLPAEAWSLRLGARHQVRDGTQRTAGSFFANAAQLVAPVDQTTDSVDISASYSSRRLQATLGYQASLFRNGQESLTWTHPFSSAVPGATQGQLALPPDNEFHQVQGSIGYQLSPTMRASADLAVGRMTQNAPFLASTLNPNLAVPSLPASSLQGRADTLNASLRFSAAPTERWRLNASYARNERDNRTPSAAYPMVSTDLFIGSARTNLPYSFTQDRVKLVGDYRAGASLKLAIGADYDARRRTLQEVGTTREITLFGRVSAQPFEKLALSVKLAHGDRDPTEYRAVPFIDPAENPLLRKYNLARRVRDSVGVRADFTATDSIGLGFDVDWAQDDYPDSAIGLTDARTLAVGADVSVAIGERTRLQGFVRTDRIRSQQTGSQQFGTPDWSGRHEDDADVLGIGIRHGAIKDKLDLGADLSVMRARNRVTIDTGALNSPFPNATTALDSVKLFATYRLRENVSLTGSYWYERYEARDWRLDGVLPGTVPNLLALGELPPRYHVHVIRIGVRYRF